MGKDDEVVISVLCSSLLEALQSFRKNVVTENELNYWENMSILTRDFINEKIIEMIKDN
jgi:hypothetical protein